MQKNEWMNKMKNEQKVTNEWTKGYKWMNKRLQMNEQKVKNEWINKTRLRCVQAFSLPSESW